MVEFILDNIGNILLKSEYYLLLIFKLIMTISIKFKIDLILKLFAILESNETNTHFLLLCKSYKINYFLIIYVSVGA